MMIYRVIISAIFSNRWNCPEIVLSQLFIGGSINDFTTLVTDDAIDSHFYAQTSADRVRNPLEQAGVNIVNESVPPLLFS
jgi:hypothetical protein